MHLKELLSGHRFLVLAVMEGERCPAVQFLLRGERQYEASRNGLMILLKRAATEGLSGFPTSLLHLVDQPNGIYEFIKGDLRLLFFKGQDSDLVVCTEGYIKKGQKAHKKEVARAIKVKSDYMEAKKSGLIDIEKE
ncbi:hypothetical protein [Acidithiobacillus caldus]|uniref:Uncharacterized protein n=1 Tax=Acidithiobacillus caldus TaxID=33059 RepID=A0A1E7YU15_9PROT|nr:hypothetical protein [Acidithiobacillus caldus]OFC36910.1 hypothetical protein BAE27_05135 [Acidithiobacillus caldus]OFC39509.1 hypothetical protein BAE28_03205 [Acidithiobacillus caldus]OFC39749.1 hypothetical protein BAE29_06670 [Acidithiobacillus caldus]OFC54352.1 hypothetical protein BAE30_11315 [Acidithiobacillus caldus]